MSVVVGEVIVKNVSWIRDEDGSAEKLKSSSEVFIGEIH